MQALEANANVGISWLRGDRLVGKPVYKVKKSRRKVMRKSSVW